MTDEAPARLTDWTGRSWEPCCGRKAAHPNSRFCSPAANCPILDDAWEDPRGVRVDAVLFGGRRPAGVPLVAEAFDWPHAVFMGASLKSEATAAAEHKGKAVMHDPFSMRPFFGYNFGDYLKHWLSLGETKDRQLPKVFMVNWFRRSAAGSIVGRLPRREDLRLDGLDQDALEWDELMSAPADFWADEADEVGAYFAQQVGESLPEEVAEQLRLLRQRVDELMS